MSLERAIALFFLLLFVLYGYTAFFTMDASLAPFMRRNPIWPSTFPKLTSVCAVFVGLGLLVNSLKQSAEESQLLMSELKGYQWTPVLIFIVMMVIYALLLRPAGFIATSIAFLSIGAIILGERRYVTLLAVSAIFTVAIWYLVQEVLGIFLRPWPSFIAGLAG